MSIVSIDGGTFQKEGHLYRDCNDNWVPSLTQLFKLQGLVDYSMIAPDVLRKAQLRGSEVHDLTAAYDRFGEIDETWLTEETAPYFRAYLKFRKENHFIPDPEWIEKGLVVKLFGMPLAMTPDRIGRLNGYDCVVELKCIEQAQLAWGLQTAGQEMAFYGSNRAGRAQRMAIQLRKDGSYRINSHTRHVWDVSQLVAALTSVYGRMEMGQNLQEKLAS